MSNFANIFSVIAGVVGIIYGVRLLFTHSLLDFLVVLFLFHAVHYLTIGLDHVKSTTYSVIAYVKRRFLHRSAGDFLAEHSYSFYVSPLDTDTLLHMNNSRYAYNADFARTEMYSKCGVLLFTFFKHYPMMKSSVIRFRTPLQLLDKVTIKSKIIHWDEKHFYIEQRFCATKKNNDSFVCAVLLGQLIIMGSSPQKILEFCYGKNNVPPVPELPKRVDHFLKFNTTSSNNLRADIEMLHDKVQ